MTLVTFTIPDDPAALPAWLEQRLVSPDLGRFIAELTAVHPGRGAGTSARQLLGPWYDSAVSDGLTGLPVETLRQLLRHPQCLLELQEAALTDGGPHWDEVAARVIELAPVVNRGRVALDLLLEAPLGPPQSADPAPVPRLRETDPARFYRRWALASTALAACLAVAVGVLAYRNAIRKSDVPAEVAWGWERSDGIPPAGGTSADYLNGLATSADEWFADRPASAPALARRINALRAGCSRLILSPHAPLAPPDREWLTEKCREWSRQVDAHLAALEAGDDPERVRARVDDTVTRLVTALRARAGRS